MISAGTGIVLLISGFSGGMLVGLLLGALLMWLLIYYWLQQNPKLFKSKP